MRFNIKSKRSSVYQFDDNKHKQASGIVGAENQTGTYALDQYKAVAADQGFFDPV